MFASTQILINTQKKSIIASKRLQLYKGARKATDIIFPLFSILQSSYS